MTQTEKPIKTPYDEAIANLKKNATLDETSRYTLSTILAIRREGWLEGYRVGYETARTAEALLHSDQCESKHCPCYVAGEDIR